MSDNTTDDKTSKPVKIFYSYSHKDEKLRDKLENHLSILKRKGVIQSWHDRRIAAGREWEGLINEHLESAEIILLLISADFLSSDYCYDREMKLAMERHTQGEAHVIPIILRECDWFDAPFGKLQALPKDGKAIKTWNDVDTAFTDVARGIKRAVEAFGKKQSVGLSLETISTTADPAQKSQLNFNAPSPTVVNPIIERGRAAGYIIHSLYPPNNPQYVNRDAVESTLTDLLMQCSASGSGVISLEGMGGSGKTTLAAQVVGQDSTTTLFPSGVLWLTVGRDRIDERLSSYICDVVQALTGIHFAAKDLSVASAALIDVLSRPAKPVLLVLDDVWTDEQVIHLLRGGTTVSRLVISRNKLGALHSAHKLELSMMSRDEAVEALFIGLSADVRHSLGGDLRDALVAFSHRWPVLITILNAALVENIRSGASPGEVAIWLIGLLSRSGPAALDRTLSVSVEKSVEVTLGATLELINDEAKEIFYSLCIFDEDVAIPDHLISVYWLRRYNLEQDECSRILGMFTHLRLIGMHWVGGSPGRVLHDVLRDFIIHRCAADIRVAMSFDLIESWRSTFLPPAAQAYWWRLPLTESFIFEHLCTQLVGAELYEERQTLLHNLRWYIAQIMSLGSAVSATADLEGTDDSTLRALEALFSQNAMIFRRESSIGGLASTLLAQVSNNAELCSLAEELGGALEWPMVRSVLPLVSLAPNLVGGHLGPIGDAAMSPDGCLIATVSDDRIALLWDAQTGTIRTRLIGHTERVRSCSFSPSGTHLLTSGMDGTARAWNVTTGNCVVVMGREGVGLLGSCWSPSGALIAGAFTDGVTVVWRAQDGKVVVSLKTELEGKGTWDCKFIGEDELITVGDDGHLRRWLITEGRCTLDLPIHTQRIRRCDVSSDGILALTASSDHTSALFDFYSGRVLGYLRGHTDRLRSATFSLDGRNIITAAEDRTVRVWDTVSLSQVVELRAHQDWVGRAFFERGGCSIVSCGGDAQVLRWTPEKKESSAYKDSQLITRGGDDTACCCFSLDGDTVYYGKVGRIKSFSLSGHTQAEFGDHHGRVLTIATDGEVLFSAGSDGRIISYRLRDKRILAECFVGARVWSLEVLHDLEQLISVAEDGILRIHARENLALLHQSKMLDGHLMACAKHPRQQEVCFVGDGSRLTTVSLSSPSNRREVFLEGYRSVWTCSYSNDGTCIAVGGEPGTQTLLVRDNGMPPTVLDTCVGRVTSAAFSCDDRLVATCGDDGYVAIWDSSTGIPLTGFRVHFPLRRCVWSPRDSKLLAVAGTGGEYLLRIDESCKEYER
jgi:WD40 repeat protein